MITSSNGNVFALLAICARNSSVPGEFPTQRPVTRNFDVSFDLRLNKRLSKQWWGWWFDTPTRPLWRHRNDMEALDKNGRQAIILTNVGIYYWCTYAPLDLGES